MQLTDPALLDHFDRELLRVLDDEDADGAPILDLDGIADFRAVECRVIAGEPMRTVAQCPR